MPEKGRPLQEVAALFNENNGYHVRKRSHSLLATFPKGIKSNAISRKWKTLHKASQMIMIKESILGRVCRGDVGIGRSPVAWLTRIKQT